MGKLNVCRDKKKEHAPNYAAYYPFGVDVFLSQRKIDHIARFVELPVGGSSSGELPSILVVNVQVNNTFLNPVFIVFHCCYGYIILRSRYKWWL